LTNATIGLTTFGQQQQQQQLQHGTTLGQTSFCETTIGGATKIGSTIAKADTSVLGQSISYTLSRQTVDYSPENYYVSIFVQNIVSFCDNLPYLIKITM